VIKQKSSRNPVEIQQRNCSIGEVRERGQIKITVLTPICLVQTKWRTNQFAPITMWVTASSKKTVPNHILKTTATLKIAREKGAKRDIEEFVNI
jgi:hypothetical protein